MTAPSLTLEKAACVHSLSPAAECADCIAVCPHDAVSLQPCGISIDPERCNNCAACVSACPPRALTMPDRPVPPRKGNVMTLVCRRHTAAEDGTVAITCIQAYGLSDLATWALAGVKRLACATGDCGTCPDLPTNPMSRLADDNAALFKAHNAAMPLLTWANEGELADWAALTTDRPEPGKRGLFRALSRPLRDEPDDPETPPLARLQSRGGAMFAFVPKIDAEHCTGCDACLCICPELALLLATEGEEGAQYRVNASHCTGCLLCEDICDANAIEVNSMTSAPATIALTSFRCRACGVDVHVPTQGPFGAGDLCPTCRATGHQSRLFQVLR